VHRKIFKALPRFKETFKKLVSEFGMTNQSFLNYPLSGLEIKEITQKGAVTRNLILSFS